MHSSRSTCCRPLRLDVSQRRFALILEVLTSHETGAHPAALAQPTCAAPASAALTEAGDHARGRVPATPRSSLRWLQIQRRKPLPAVRQRRAPRLHISTNMPDWDSCRTASTLQDVSPRSSVITSGHFVRAQSNQRARSTTALHFSHGRPPRGSPASLTETALRPDKRHVQQAGQSVVNGRVHRAGEHSISCARARPPSARSNSASSGIGSPGSVGSTAPPAQWICERAATPESVSTASLNSRRREVPLWLQIEAPADIDSSSAMSSSPPPHARQLQTRASSADTAR